MMTKKGDPYIKILSITFSREED